MKRNHTEQNNKKPFAPSFHKSHPFCLEEIYGDEENSDSEESVAPKTLVDRKRILTLDKKKEVLRIKRKQLREQKEKSEEEIPFRLPEDRPELEEKVGITRSVERKGDTNTIKETHVIDENGTDVVSLKNTLIALQELFPSEDSASEEVYVGKPMKKSTFNV
ncbi:hypothetical protein EIN_172030 [Entamoeba invadens IP1]|uniref:Uncharacterized protein n=1 Tax=Entamoeba invadens IP1 TaxID=370355 RepID=A0A0A1U117_ENTIV|nr:hypothetical protein EIN_172030 [Entamoeba invadens IP1]ELP84598.1 hypothetical protein EIN_172030 [Entamoeba invadens IP1]|eukprot:XP_004183944.1 hypothetical protein EIN_172030 [Entamoeba invadens IP1]